MSDVYKTSFLNRLVDFTFKLYTFSKRPIQITAFVCLTGLACLFFFQRKLVYASDFPSGSRLQVDKPSKYKMPYEDVELICEDGVKIKAYAIKPQTVSKKTVIMLGPNAGNIGHSLPAAYTFYSFGFNVISLSYRGYGLSEGSPSETGLQSDCRALLDYVAQSEDFKDTSIILYGRSLGGAVSIYFAKLAKECGLNIVKGMVLENTFLSLPEVVPHALPKLRYLTSFVWDQWPSKHDILSLDPDVPVLFLSSLKDEIVPPAHMKELFKICPSTYKEFHEFPNNYHNDAVFEDSYWSHVHSFIYSSVEPKGSF